MLGKRKVRVHNGEEGLTDERYRKLAKHILITNRKERKMGDPKLLKPALRHTSSNKVPPPKRSVISPNGITN